MISYTGVYAHVVIDLNDNEYTVTCYSPDSEDEYFTDDKKDAEITARKMVEDADKHCKEFGIKEEEFELVFEIE